MTTPAEQAKIDAKAVADEFRNDVHKVITTLTPPASCEGLVDVAWRTRLHDGFDWVSTSDESVASGYKRLNHDVEPLVTRANAEAIIAEKDAHIKWLENEVKLATTIGKQNVDIMRTRAEAAERERDALKVGRVVVGVYCRMREPDIWELYSDPDMMEYHKQYATEWKYAYVDSAENNHE